jgi:hypothetical protein
VSAATRWRLSALAALCLSLPCLTGCSDGDGEVTDAGSSDEPPCSIVLPTCPADAGSWPSWSGQVQGIVSQSCGGCHTDGGIEESQFNFSTYGDVHHLFGSMLDQVYGCNMPPADAAPLTPTNQQALLEWLVCAAPDN